MSRVDSHSDVSRQHSAGNRGKSADHDDIQFGKCHLTDKRADHKRRFGLAHKHIGRRRQCFGTRRTERLLHNHRERAHDELHDSQVI